ncbi:hypothetical protein DL96DRAFT_1566658 [Flagelloscypha sp. PMI_526]|nr:hypothetical protein DL96DRAFT_1566658 [Flagelloscypha sp. PMI_526]
MFMVHSNQQLVHDNSKKTVFRNKLEGETILVVSGRTPEQVPIASGQAGKDGMKRVQPKAANRFSMGFSGGDIEWLFDHDLKEQIRNSRSSQAGLRILIKFAASRSSENTLKDGTNSYLFNLVS